jgi:precorrin-8X/cobalt-precorrin-8 methylmutase
VSGTSRARRTVHPIEIESYAILRQRLDLAHLPPLSRAVAERVVHASADLAYADDLVLDEDALRRGTDALTAGAPIVADSRMVAAGITSREVHVPLADPQVAKLAERWSTTRSAAAIRRAVADVGVGAVWLIGNAPTALFELLAHPDADPALVIGLPVGFVGAAESKQALRDRGWPAVTNVSEKGGSAVAAAACNALLYHREDTP